MCSESGGSEVYISGPSVYFPGWLGLLCPLHEIRSGGGRCDWHMSRQWDASMCRCVTMPEMYLEADWCAGWLYRWHALCMLLSEESISRNNQSQEKAGYGRVTVFSQLVWLAVSGSSSSPNTGLQCELNFNAATTLKSQILCGSSGVYTFKWK